MILCSIDVSPTGRAIHWVTHRCQADGSEGEIATEEPRQKANEKALQGSRAAVIVLPSD
jgi:hypothetical protein